MLNVSVQSAIYIYTGITYSVANYTNTYPHIPITLMDWTHYDAIILVNMK